MRTLTKQRGIRLLCSLAILGLSAQVHAGGLYFSDRGVRPMGRAGAWVAGADDLGAIWYNPAGIADAGNSLLVDFTWLRFSNEYTRRLRIADADNTVRVVDSPTIEGTSPVLPLPTMAGSIVLDPDKRWTLAAGMFAPYVVLASYDSKVKGVPSPARYTLGSFNGSRMALPGMWLSYKPVEWLRFGAGIHALIGTFVTTLAFTVSPPDRLLAAPEQVDYDAESQLSVGTIVAPTANAGMIVIPHPMFRIGISGQLPTHISSDATLKVRLPTSVVFDGVQLEGDKAHVEFDLPGIFRTGVEFRPTKAVRMELAYVVEFWSIHKEIVAVPERIRITGITAGPPTVNMPNVVVPRHFQDSHSFRFGGQYSFPIAGYQFDARAGISYETSAVPPAYMSLSSLDFNKWILSFGGSLYVGKHWRFDALLAHSFAASVQVATNEAQITRINPLAGNAKLESVNGGTYTARADLIGLGMNYKF
jgi:long-chain fatty acid transport protein